MRNVYMKVIRLFMVFFLFAGNVFTQDALLPTTYRGLVETGLKLQMWKLEYSLVPITQLAMPITVVFPIGNQLNLTISHTPAYSKWGGSQIGGFSDTWIQGTYIFWREKVMVNLGMGAPTGKTRLKGAPEGVDYLENNEFELSRWLSLNVFRFQLPVYGQGLCSTGGIALAVPIDDRVVIGFGGQCLLRNPYHPLEYQYLVGDITKTSDEVYKPGNELSGHLGADVQVVENTKIMLDGTYTYYWPDRFSDVEVYGAGKKITVNLGLLYKFNEKFVSGQVLYRFKGKNKVVQELEINLEDKNRNGFEFEIDLVYKVFSGDNYSIYLYGDGRIFDGNEFDEVGKASVGGGGFGADLTLNDNWMVDFSLKYYSGEIFTEIGQRHVSGMDIFFGFRYTY